MATYTVSALARRCGVSRTAILYYEARGLLQPSHRSPGNYRLYTEDDLRRLREIRGHRRLGLRIADIAALMRHAPGDATSVLERRLHEIDREIRALREHRRGVQALLGEGSLRKENTVMTKDKWISIMKAAGFTSADMHRWHAQFEKSDPDEHQAFLEYLHIAPDEIRAIREQSRDVR